MKSLGLSILFLIFLASCGPKDSSELLKDIKENESKLFDQNQSFKFDKELAQQTIASYGAYIDAFPNDSLTPELMFKKADLHRAVEEYETAIDIYQRLETDYKDYKKTPHSLFLQGFVYENEIGDFNKAEERYKAFLEKYPNHDLADDVRFSLNHLGKSPEDIIKEFERSQQPAMPQDTLI